MQKEDLKSLVAQMYNELLNNIDMQEEPTTKQVVAFLEDSIQTIKNINDSEIDSIEHAKLAFKNTYKEIAHKSISSYKDTNGVFQELANIHNETLKEYETVQIDLPAINKKFTAIQEQMSSEVMRANEIITDLTLQVKELEHDSNIDVLTNVYNRRALTDYLEELCKRKNIPYELHLFILDIDDFKKVNDSYGHIAGDKVLIFITNILKKTLRDGDKIFRYGGEEFVIILNRTTPEACLEIANRILTIIRSNKLIYKGDALQVTLSIGSTRYINGDTPETLIGRADKALYKSKQNGKDQMTTEREFNGN